MPQGLSSKMRQGSNSETDMIAAQHAFRRTLSPPRPAVASSRAEAASRRRPEHELRAATAAGTLVLHYQPRLCLATGEIVANEALVRRPHREQGLTPLGILMPVAERSGLADLIGAWGLTEACREAACWSTARLSVNVSARQLQSGALPFQLAEALEQSGLAPDRLELEVAESLLADGSIDTLLALSAIRDLGIGLALDNLGAGFASLSMLKRLPLTTMKLDRSLVRELPAGREDAAITRALIGTGRAMRLTTVAEGIETEAQRAFLAGIGCDEGQGSLFSLPLPAGQLCSMLGAARS